MYTSTTVNQAAWIKQRGRGESANRMCEGRAIISTLSTMHVICAMCCTKVLITGTNEHTIQAHV